MTDPLDIIEARIAAAEQAYQTAETAHNERHNVRGAYAKLSASLEATQIMVQSDAYRQGLIGAWELLTGKSWTGVRTLYDNEIQYEAESTERVKRATFVILIDRALMRSGSPGEMMVRLSSRVFGPVSDAEADEASNRWTAEHGRHDVGAYPLKAWALSELDEATPDR